MLSIIKESGATLDLRVFRQGMILSQDSLPPGTTFTARLQKQGGALGLRLAGGKDKPNGLGFIYVKSVVDGSAADTQNIRSNDILMTVSSHNM